MYQVFKNVLFTKGYNRTLMYDSLKSEIHFLPNEMFDLIDADNYILADNKVNEPLISLLLQKELVFKSNTQLNGYFPHLNTDSEVPYHIVTSVIELSDLTAENIHKFNTPLNNGSIGQFNFIVSGYTSLESLNSLACFIEANEADAFEITIEEEFKHLEYLFTVIDAPNKIIIFNNFKNEQLPELVLKRNRYVNPTDLINLHLSLNYLTYFESKDSNVYFNRKIFISSAGLIKNSEETAYVHGNIGKLESFNINEILNSASFKEYWNIRKDDTIVCNDCEFRRFCIDNRVPEKTAVNKWYHKDECAYNPYISKWQHEEEYMPIAQCGVTATADGVSIDLERLNKINEEIWKI